MRGSISLSLGGGPPARSEEKLVPRKARTTLPGPDGSVRRSSSALYRLRTMLYAPCLLRRATMHRAYCIVHTASCSTFLQLPDVSAGVFLSRGGLWLVPGRPVYCKYGRLRKYCDASPRLSLYARSFLQCHECLRGGCEGTVTYLRTLRTTAPPGTEYIRVRTVPPDVLSNRDDYRKR